MVVKPPTERGRKTREKLVVSAAGLFRQRGVRSTSTDDVLVESGCGRSQLYHYFAGKQELVAAVLEYQLNRLLDDQLPALAKADTWAGIRRWLDQLPDVVTGTPGVIAACPIGALAGELAGIDEQMRRALVVAFDRWAGHLAVGLKA